MAFIHQDEIVALEGVHGHGLLTGRFAQPVDVDDMSTPRPVKSVAPSLS